MAGETLTVDELRKMLQEALQPGGNSGAPPTTPAAGSAAAPATTPSGLPTAGLVTALIEALSKLTTAITGSKPADKLSESLQIVTAFTGLKDASNLATGAIGNLAGAVPYLGAAFKKAGLDLSEELKIARAGGTGVGQGDASSLRERALEAGFKSVQDYIDYLKTSYGNNLRTIGRTAEDSSFKLADVASRLSKTDEGQNLLKRNLMTSDQLAQIAGIAAEGKSSMLKSEEGRQALAEAAAILAAKIDAQAKLTGETTDKIIQDRKDQQSSAEEQLRLQALSNDQQRLQYTQNQQLFATQGKSMQEVVGVIQAGGRLTKDQQAMLQVATGGRGGQLIQLVREQKRTAGLAVSDPARMEADKRLRDFTANMSAYQNSPAFARYINTTGNDQQRAAGLKVQQENKEKQGIGVIMANDQVTPAEAKRRQEEAALNNGRGYTQEGLLNEKQVPNVGAKPYEVLAEANEQGRKTAIAIASQVTGIVNALGRNSEGLEKFREFLNPLVGPPGQTVEQREKMVQDYFNDLSGGNAPGKVPGVDNNTGRPTVVSTPAMNVNANNVVVQPAATPPVTAPVTAPVEGSRGKGTYGETGAAAEIKDVVAQLHKGETVLTPDQRENMIKDSANAAFDKILGKKNSKEAEDQNVQYKNNDKNDAAFIKMQQDSETDRSTRANIPVPTPSPVNIGDLRTEITEGLTQTTARQTADMERIKADLSKQAATIKDPAQIETPKIDTSFVKQAEQMLESQTQGVFGNLRTAFAKQQRQAGPSINDEFKNYQPKVATVTPANQPAPQVEQPRIESRENVTLKDLNDQLMMLNKSIAQLVYSSTTNGTFAEQQIRVTKKLSGNRFG